MLFGQYCMRLDLHEYVHIDKLILVLHLYLIRYEVHTIALVYCNEVNLCFKSYLQLVIFSCYRG